MLYRLSTIAARFRTRSAPRGADPGFARVPRGLSIRPSGPFGRRADQFGRRANRFGTALIGLAAAGLIAVTAARAADDAGSAPEFRRGVSIHELLNWGNLSRTEPGRYADAPFVGPNHRIADDLLRNTASAGFDFVRLTVDPGPFLQLAGADAAALDDTLMADVARLRRFGFAVLVDIHPVEQVPLYGRALMLPGARPGFDDYRSLVVRLARLLGDLHSRSVGLEIMNEPDGYGPAREGRWQEQLEALTAAARAAAPDLTLVLSGAEGGDEDGLLHLDPRRFPGRNVMYTFHYYEPHMFTHQGVPGDDAKEDVRRFLAGLPYPSAIPFDPAAFAENNVAADPTLMPAPRRRLLRGVRAAAAAYVAGGYGRERVRRDFDRVSAWAADNGVPADRVLLGEFSVARQSGDHVGADPPSAEAWLRDVREEAEAHGFAWAYWGLAGASPMQLVVSDGAAALDPGVLAALGMRAPAGVR